MGDAAKEPLLDGSQTSRAHHDELDLFLFNRRQDDLSR